jgi:hypothetical protein
VLSVSFAIADVVVTSGTDVVLVKTLATEMFVVIFVVVAEDVRHVVVAIALPVVDVGILVVVDVCSGTFVAMEPVVVAGPIVVADEAVATAVVSGASVVVGGAAVVVSEASVVVTAVCVVVDGFVTSRIN